jgi:hypothetical protein
MLALEKWNGGVIIISHDERFITTVAKEVSRKSFFTRLCTDINLLLSSGYVVMVPSPSSEETYKVTRYFFGH